MFTCVSSGHDTYFYQLFMDKDDRVLLPTTQQLLELSFMQSDVKLSEVCFQLYQMTDLTIAPLSLINSSLSLCQYFSLCPSLSHLLTCVIVQTTVVAALVSKQL